MVSSKSQLLFLSGGHWCYLSLNCTFFQREPTHDCSHTHVHRCTPASVPQPSAPCHSALCWVQTRGLCTAVLWPQCPWMDGWVTVPVDGWLGNSARGWMAVLHGGNLMGMPGHARHKTKDLTLGNKIGTHACSYVGRSSKHHISWVSIMFSAT